MLLVDSRRSARTRDDGTLVVLADQDRELWDQAFIDEGVALITDGLARLPLGPYQVQAATEKAYLEDRAARLRPE